MWQEQARAFSKAPQIDANVRKSQWQNSGPGSWPPFAWRTSSDLLESFGPSRQSTIMEQVQQRLGQVPKLN